MLKFRTFFDETEAPIHSLQFQIARPQAMGCLWCILKEWDLPMKHEKAKLHILVVCQAGLGEIVKAEPLHNTLKANLLKSRQQIRFSRQLLQKNDFFSSKPRKPPRRAGVILHRTPQFSEAWSLCWRDEDPTSYGTNNISVDQVSCKT